MQKQQCYSNLVMPCACQLKIKILSYHCLLVLLQPLALHVLVLFQQTICFFLQLLVMRCSCCCSCAELGLVVLILSVCSHKLLLQRLNPAVGSQKLLLQGLTFSLTQPCEMLLHLSSALQGLHSPFQFGELCFLLRNRLVQLSSIVGFAFSLRRAHVLFEVFAFGLSHRRWIRWPWISFWS